MAASTMSASLVQTRVTMRTSAPAPRRTALIVRAQAEPTSRRAALSMVAGAFGSLSLAVGAAQAKTTVAYQESINKAGSSSGASMSGYTMEGTRKRGLSPQERKEFLEERKKELLKKQTK